MKSLYLLLHIFTIAFPLIRSFEPRIRYASRWKALFPAIVITAVFFITWDILFTKAMVWGFNENYFLGINLFGLPIEEWLFFITVPFASIFIYDCVRYFLPRIQSTTYLYILSWLFATILFVLAILNTSKAYTFWNFIFAAGFFSIVLLFRPSWLGFFWVGYLIHLIPFLVVNGVLTGTWLDAPIVWYNNDENLGIRIGTIPIEDTIYAFLLLLMNVTFYERFNIFFKTRT